MRGSLLPLAVLALLPACNRSAGDAGSTPSSTPNATNATSKPSASTSASAAAPTAPAGPVVAIPAGQLTAGTACGDHPRLPSEELAGVAMDLGAFDIDAYPYPNDPDKPAERNVSRDDAKKLCEARGRRLCSELEWERACKGPENRRYEYGDRFDPKACPAGLGTKETAAAYPKCASAFGVHAMHGFGWEWTSSEWKRGKPSGKGVLRGGFGNQPYAHMRCSAAREADPSMKESATGFRCCGGPANTAEVVLSDEDPAPAPVEEVTMLDAGLVARIKRALVNGSFTDPEGTTGEIAKVWRWRPVSHEELLVVRYDSRSRDGGVSVQPLVVQLCEKTAQLLGRIAAPVERMEAPVAKPEVAGSPAAVGSLASLGIALVDGTSAGEAKLTYQFAQVNITQPPWLKRAK